MDFPKTKKGKNGEESLGLALLGVVSSFSIWSAVNPSFFTIRSFAGKDKASQDNIKFGMHLGLALDVILGLGLALAYGQKGLWPGVLTAATGAGLWLAYDRTLKRTHINNPRGMMISDGYMASAGGMG